MTNARARTAPAGRFLNGLWVPDATGSATPPSPRRLAAEQARIRLAASGPPAHTLAPVHLGSGFVGLRSEPIPVATPPADLDERLARHAEAAALDAELAALEEET